jgi:acetyl esterase/lipase
VRARLLVVPLLLLLPPPTPAADQTVLGRTLVVTNPSTPDRRRITVRAAEHATDDTLVGDPVTNGATVVITVDGQTESHALPAGTFWTGDAVQGFRYADVKGENGPARRARIRTKHGVFHLTVDVDGRLGPVAIAPPNPGSTGCVLFTIGGGDSYSVAFSTGTVTNRGAALFKVAQPTAEASCLPPTTTTTTSTTTTTQCPADVQCCVMDAECPVGDLCTANRCAHAFPYVAPPGTAPLRYRDPIFATVEKTADITYGSAVDASGTTVTLTLDLYEPTGDAITARPAIVWVHGGSFCCGDKTSPELVDESNVFSMKGFVNASINYRLEPGGCTSVTATCITAIEEARDDAQTAVRFLRTNAVTYGIDPTRIGIGGSSAGAITALNVGFLSAEDPDAAVGGAVSLSGADLLTTIGPGDAPSLLFHGTADPLVPYQWAVNTFNGATNAGLDSFLTTWQGAGHVPYVQHRSEILDQTTNFLYWEMDLAHAAQ